jgi:hypothetical protein
LNQQPSRQREKGKLKLLDHYLAESVFCGGMREAANKDGAIRVSDDLGISEGLVCKRRFRVRGGNRKMRVRGEGSENYGRS